LEAAVSFTVCDRRLLAGCASDSSTAWASRANCSLSAVRVVVSSGPVRRGGVYDGFELAVLVSQDGVSDAEFAGYVAEAGLPGREGNLRVRRSACGRVKAFRSLAGTWRVYRGDG
jgi:hypothetical protein